MDRLRGRWALVTGASSGIGEAFTRRLARAGCNVVIVARREDRLQILAKQIEERGVECRVIALDLAAPDAGASLHAQTAEAGLEIDLLVNNAGFGLYGRDVQLPWDREREMLELDIVTLVDLTKRYLPSMLARNRGWIIQVASVGAYQATPTYAAYSAAKAFVLSYGEALAYEHRESPVNITVLSPGMTRSEFLEVSGQTPNFIHRATMMEADTVADIGLRAVLRGRPSIVPGIVNKIAIGLVRLLPRRAQAASAYLTMNPKGESNHE